MGCNCTQPCNCNRFGRIKYIPVRTNNSCPSNNSGGTPGPQGPQGPQGERGPVGPVGPSGTAGFISVDSGNILTLGEDGGLYVPAVILTDNEDGSYTLTQGEATVGTIYTNPFP